MEVSIIIVNYNTAELLMNCIDSLKKKTSGLHYEIIVVDNNSSDNSVKQLKANFSDVIVIESKVNLGFGKGNNLGASYAKGEFLFFLNSDTLLINNAIKIMFDFAKLPENRDVACIGGNLYHLDESPNFSYSISFPSLFEIALYRSGLKAIWNNDFFNVSGIPKTVAIIIGADMLIPKDKFDLVNGFDPSYFMYVEEGDLQYRLYMLGLASKSVPQAKIIHMQGASSVNLFKLKSEVSSYIIFFNKFFNRKTVYAYKAIELFFASLKYIFFTINRNNLKRKDYGDIIKFLIQ